MPVPEQEVGSRANLEVVPLVEFERYYEGPTTRAAGHLQVTLTQVDRRWTFLIPGITTEVHPAERTARLVPAGAPGDREMRIVVEIEALPNNHSRLLVMADEQFWKKEGQFLWSAIESRIPPIKKELSQSTLEPAKLETKQKTDRHHYPRAKRREIVEHYRNEREGGTVTNKDAWARQNYYISGRTLRRYEKEFPVDT